MNSFSALILPIFLAFFRRAFPSVDAISSTSSTDFIPRRVYAYQREISKPDLKTTAGDGKGNTEHKQILCINGKIRHRRCVCNMDHFGEHCEWKMFCKGYDREWNGSCVECNDNFYGDRCERPICQNGGTEDKYEQYCQCPKPHSGNYCEVLRMEDVYTFYNTRGAMIGPLGLLTVIPLLICFYMCEKRARVRQVSRIQKSWSEQRKASIRSAQIATLLAEKV